MNVVTQYCQVFEVVDLYLRAAKKAGMIAADIREHLY
jgi:hypothetical protein